MLLSLSRKLSVLQTSSADNLAQQQFRVFNICTDFLTDNPITLLGHWGTVLGHLGHSSGALGALIWGTWGTRLGHLGHSSGALEEFF